MWRVDFYEGKKSSVGCIDMLLCFGLVKFVCGYPFCFSDLFSALSCWAQKTCLTYGSCSFTERCHVGHKKRAQPTGLPCCAKRRAQPTDLPCWAKRRVRPTVPCGFLPGIWFANGCQLPGNTISDCSVNQHEFSGLFAHGIIDNGFDFL